MEEPLRNREGENLDKLLSFFSLNTPKPLQSLEETETLLDELLVNFFTEVIEECSGPSSYYGKRYPDYFYGKIGVLDYLFYETLVILELNSEHFGKEEGEELKKRIELNGYKLEDIYDDLDSSEQKLEKLQDFLKLSALFERKIGKVFYFIEEL